MASTTRRHFLRQTGLLAAGSSLPATWSARAAQTAAVSDEVAFLPAVELAGQLRRGAIGSEELTRHFIARIEKYDARLNAVVVRDFDRALEAARAADAARARGEDLGPLHGLPMTIKESFDIAGLPTTWGNLSAKDSSARQDAVMVQRYKAAGAHFLGKTNVPLNLGDYQSYNEVYGTTNNPWDTGRTPGGSSGGSAAALAAGLTGLESGSDIGGSIRNPAHFCGVYGHKPTLGIVPSFGHQPAGLPPSPQHPDLAVVGPLARSAEDLALALDLVSGPNRLDAPGWRLELPPPRVKELSDLRVALWSDDPMAPVAREVSGRIESVGRRLEGLGATVSSEARPKFPAKMSQDVYMPILGAMTSGPAGELKYSDWMALNGRRGFLRTQWQQFFEEWDVVLCPIAVTPAFPQDQSPLATRTVDVDGEARPYFGQLFWAGLATVSYLPGTVFPTGPSEGGLPIGVQAIGPEYGDRTTIEVARLIAEEIGGFQPPPGYGD